MNHVTPELEKWMRYGERGASSETMAEVFAGFPHGFLADGHARAHPADPADFRRCVLFLEAVPEMRQRMDEMKQVSPEWAMLVEHWAELEQLGLEEAPTGRCPKLYYRMRSLIHEAQINELIKEIEKAGFGWHFHYGNSPYIRIGLLTVNKYPLPVHIRQALELAKSRRHNL